MRVISFNTQGIEQATEKGLFTWLADQDADVICLQDIRAREYQLDDAKYHIDGYYPYFFEAFEDGYSGVAIYTRHLPKAVMTGLGFELCDYEGRFIQADFENVSISSLLVPSGLKNDAAQKIKDQFMEHLLAHFKKTQRKRRDFIFCGTLNTAHRTPDISNWYVNQSISGFLPSERAWMEEVIGELGFVDAFREVNKTDRQYTWWPDYNRARKLNEGARLDYHITTANLLDTINDGHIAKEQAFSEFAPLIMDYDLDL